MKRKGPANRGKSMRSQLRSVFVDAQEPGGEKKRRPLGDVGWLTVVLPMRPLFRRVLCGGWKVR